MTARALRAAGHTVAVVAVALTALVLAASSAAAGSASVTWCREVGVGTYETVTVDADVALRHVAHAGPHDVIPPFAVEVRGVTQAFGGSHYDEAGQHLLDAGCVASAPAALPRGDTPGAAPLAAPQVAPAPAARPVVAASAAPGFLDRTGLGHGFVVVVLALTVLVLAGLHYLVKRHGGTYL